MITQPQTTVGTRLIENRQETDMMPVRKAAQRLRFLIEADKPTVEGRPAELAPRLLPLSPDAKALLIKFHDEIEVLQGQGGELQDLRAVASKIAEQAARIAGVLTIFENENAPRVELDTMENAITLARYYLSEAKRLSGCAGISPEIEQAEKLRAWLCERWAGLALSKGLDPNTITPRDIIRNGPNALREAPTVKRCLNILAGSGWVVELPKGTTVNGATPKLAYRVVTG